MRGLRFSIVSLIIAIGFAFQPGSAWGGVLIRLKPYLPKTDAKAPTNKFYVYCYSMWTGEPADCEIELNLREKDYPVGEGDPAGHVNGEHGIRLRPVGKLRHEGGGVERLNLKFNTNDSVAYIEYVLPEVSGAYVIDFSYKFWWMSSPVFIPEVREYRIKVDVMEFPPSTDGTYILTGNEPWKDVGKRHPKNHHAKGWVHDKLKSVAGFYYNFGDGNVIQFNDMSLPWGGLFDIFGNWQPDHHSHRTGTDVDVDRWVNGIEINCDADYQLKETVKYIRGIFNTKFPELKCESGGRKHINFD